MGKVHKCIDIRRNLWTFKTLHSNNNIDNNLKHMF
jgi:hypothetical protein